MKKSNFYKIYSPVKSSPPDVPVVGRGDGPEPLLAGGVPDLELDLLTVQLNRPDFEIYA